MGAGRGVEACSSINLLFKNYICLRSKRPFYNGAQILCFIYPRLHLLLHLLLVLLLHSLPLPITVRVQIE